MLLYFKSFNNSQKLIIINFVLIFYQKIFFKKKYY